MLLELVMIVKNSGGLLGFVLENIKPYIDRWTILDTGSTDGTQELIRRHLTGVEGALYEEPFVDFLTSRNRSLELSSKKCQYTIILDDSYNLNGGSELRKFLIGGRQECYNIKIIDQQQNTAYFSNRIIRSAAGKRYEKYRVHEAIPDDKPQTSILPAECFIVDYRDHYHTHRSQKRHAKDIEILLEHYREDPRDTRVIYYLASTYLAMNNPKKTLKYYKKLLKLPESRENEVYEAMMFMANRDREKNVDWKVVETQLFNIIKKFRYRIEPLFLLFIREYNEGNLTRAYQYIKLCHNVKEPVNYCYEYDYSIYRWYIPYFYIDLSLKLGLVDQGVEALKNILKIYPHNQRFLNIKYFITKKSGDITRLSDSKTVVVHSGGMIGGEPWNPNNISSIGSGSEIMAINLSEMLARRGYRVILFGHFTDDSAPDTDYQGTWNGVEYLDYTLYNMFVERYHVDYLIVSRWSSNLVYYDNIKNVYLWAHDVYPQDAQYIFQTHPVKFKGILCLSEWQRQLNIKEYKLPDNIVHLTSNAIFMDRFKNRVSKVPYRFIWTSDIFRGLEYAVDMFKSIKTRYPESSFKIFGKRCNLSAELAAEIKEHPSVEFYDRVPQEQLTRELQLSDVWLYPNNFEETYCISAVEAAAAGALICCNSHAGLLTTVNDRGAVIIGKYDRDRLLEVLYKTLDNPQEKNMLISRGLEYASTQDFEAVTDSFINRFLS